MSLHFDKKKGEQLYEHATRGLLIYYVSTLAIFFSFEVGNLANYAR